MKKGMIAKSHHPFSINYSSEYYYANILTGFSKNDLRVCR